MLVTGDQSSHSIDLEADNNGGCWATWVRVVNENCSVYLQHLNSNGIPLLEENGIPVCPLDSLQFTPTLYLTSACGVYVNWYEERNGFSGIFSQVFDSAGVMQLPAEGKEIYSGISNEIRNLDLISNTNGINFFWLDNRSYSSQGSKIYMQSIDSDGNPAFAENGVPLDANSDIAYSGFVSCYNPASDLISLVYGKEIEYIPKVFANAVNSAGVLLWGDEGLALSSNEDRQNVADRKSVV